MLLRSHLNSDQVDNATYREGMQALNRPLEEISASQLRKQGDSLGISVDPMTTDNLGRIARLLGLEDTKRLRDALQNGVPHSVLNARHHTQEAAIVARAGEVGAVTIATNMAGRGVDIKLGGELTEGILSEVYRVLGQNGISAHGLSFAEMAQSLRSIDPERYHLYREAVDQFLKHVDDEERVKKLGGLHVIGTERHEARRIDNQLRGRSGRQGDPGSSTFYLSLEDDLMRRFGGTRVSDLAARLGSEDDIPISMGLVSRAIANAQTQVEGYNFDIRKHLIDYDDVLNTQRNVIYEQRTRILSKPDLRDDVWAMIEAEIAQHVDPLYALAPRNADEDEIEAERAAASLRLINFLETIQPITPLSEGRLFPSFSLSHVLSTLPLDAGPEALREALDETLREVLHSQQRAVLANVELVVSRTLDSEDASIDRWLEAATIAFEGAELDAEDAGQELDALEAARAVKSSIGIELNTRPLRDLEGRELERAIMEEVRALARSQVRLRMLAQVQARLPVPWQAPATLLSDDASSTAGQEQVMSTVLDSVESALAQHAESLAAEVAGIVQAQIREPSDCTPARATAFLHEIRFGTRSDYDKQHRRINRRFERFHYTPWVAEQISSWEKDRIESAILEHLGNALHAWEKAWADAELQRIASISLGELDRETQAGLESILGEERLGELQTTRVSDLPAKDLEVVRRHLGARVLFNVQRQLMLEITSRYWVEHLTAMEDLRQGIGLQSYAQKDPLAEYRVRAYEMFQDLLHAIQSEVVTAMFTYRPHDLDQVRVGIDRRKRSDSLQSPQGGSTSQGQKSGRASRKRRKRRKRR
jgi:preprotein translocase subunit SecA